MLYLKLSGIWILLVVSAIATFRTGVLLPKFGEQTAHQFGTLIFLIVQFIVIYFFINKMKIKEMKTLLRIGAYWVALTIIF